MLFPGNETYVIETPEVSLPQGFTVSLWFKARKPGETRVDEFPGHPGAVYTFRSSVVADRRVSRHWACICVHLCTFVYICVCAGREEGTLHLLCRQFFFSLPLCVCACVTCGCALSLALELFFDWFFFAKIPVFF